MVKGLLQVEPSPKKTIGELSGMLLIDVNLIDEDTKLDEVLKHFESGTKGHLAVVVGKEDDQQRKKVCFSCTLYCISLFIILVFCIEQAVGIISLEDILEELLQEEIYDEMDNTFRLRKRI